MDIAYHRLALSQSRSLSRAQLLIAKLRNDVDLEQLREAQNQPHDQAAGHDTITEAFAAVAASDKPLAVSRDAGRLIDKLA